MTISGENKPPTFSTPNQKTNVYIITRAKKNSGTEKPRKEKKAKK